MLENAAALAEKVNWEWSMGLERFVTRYGHLGVYYYKQFIPFGIVNNIEYPPKRIGEKVYQMAGRIYKQSLEFAKKGWG